MKKERYGFEDLVEIMKKLRSPDGCPWDREQTHESLKEYFIEETYEVLEAIDLKSPEKLCEELGDVLLQVIFHATIAEENGQFTIYDVVDGISRKMVHRHQHVFGKEHAETAADVLNLWDKIKKEEKGTKTQTDILKSVPANLPALMRSYKVQEKAAKVGFDWDNAEDAWKKVKEEMEEFHEACRSGDMDKTEEELGDLLFAIVNVSRFLKIQPELALTKTINKFIKRFEYIETKSSENGKKLTDMTLQEMDALWDEAKKLEDKRGDNDENR
ncbi:MazG family protein [Thermoclostridium stercorarium subsp. stercorarium DSM 8532]|uniref:MazG family protein n=3 Tax=Thermoclostridium stercorarium TaxID=1510 RepID=L7VLC2_THES1|nr:nucleoside triphosphate pyrophosphohydrolase [Thermoclostridium stercorarium]AGC67281.1 MazG family protein [Thermoclostridium stercorarium subsp. stercorarium DSM 8532]AGI38347.1 MazG [Thermoclostridium stercorarium subsp. stercorarium DSM 8532]ANW97784.1 pyrophosphatase [Thermoclostridium stercorarium subsp. thermolacticum DSM 2910]ANX00310.1 pyrophosphatase [Thermoclostridium stercorarium subsp. leptospartum DSM 9219]UZQ85858.1 nucleoside triphosphate pyrophosphohydrolase [Thermoclostrid